MHTTPTSGDYVIFYFGFGLVLVMAILVVLLFVRSIRNMVLRHQRRKAARLKRLAVQKSVSASSPNRKEDGNTAQTPRPQ